MIVLLLLILPAVRSQTPTQATLPHVEFRNYQRHPFNAVQFVSPKPTKNGPILFPNDAPPPPPPPLIVTSRPLSESIARSELNPNNSLPAPSQRHQVSYRPQYQPRVQQTYQPYAYNLATVTPANDFGSSILQYNDNGNTGPGREDKLYNDYEHASPLYSGEADYDKVDHQYHELNPTQSTAAYRPVQYDYHKQYNMVDNGRSEYRQSRRRKRIGYRRSPNWDYYHDRRHIRNPYIKHRRRMNPIMISSRRLQDRTYELDNQVENDKQLTLRPSYRVKTETDKSARIKNKRAGHSTEYLSDSSFIVLRSRTSQKLDRITDNNDGNPESINWHSSENLSDRSYKILKRRPSHSPEDSDNIERILHAPASHSKYKVSRSQASARHMNQISKKLMRRPFHSISNRTTQVSHTTTTETVTMKKMTSHRIEDISENNENQENRKPIAKKRPTYDPNNKSEKDSAEVVAQDREIQLLYEVTGDGQRDQKTTSKSAHPIKERFKALSRPQARIPDPPTYYTATRNDGHDNEKDHNHHAENYAFSYTVKDNKTGDDFSHSQQSTGTATNGEYRVRLPDGRTQIVSYTADEDGYKADVRYDDHINHDNSIDDISRENQFNANDAFKNNDIQSAYNDHLDSHDITDTVEFRYKADKPHHLGNHFLKQPNLQNNHQDFHANDFIVHTNEAHKHAYVHRNDYVHKNDYTHGNEFADTTKNIGEDVKSLTDNNNDYLEHYNEKNLDANGQALKTRDDDYFQFTDEIPFSKEVMDYSNEFNHAYQPHKSKFSSFDNHKSVKSTVRPSYDEIKDLFVTNPNLRRHNSFLQVGSTVRPNYEENKPNLYTSIRDVVDITPAPVTYSTPFASTPRGYLVSTIANLKHQVNLAHKPVLSRQYIDKISKYLSYK